MSCKTIERLILESEEGLLAEGDRRKVEGHLRGCPGCGKPVANGYVFCPACGRPRQAVCPACKKPAEAGWKVCPYCGAGLDTGKSEQA